MLKVFSKKFFQDQSLQRQTVNWEFNKKLPRQVFTVTSYIGFPVSRLNAPNSIIIVPAQAVQVSVSWPTLALGVLTPYRRFTCKLSFWFAYEKLGNCKKKSCEYVTQNWGVRLVALRHHLELKSTQFQLHCPLVLALCSK